jgi:hypothetical protein
VGQYVGVDPLVSRRRTNPIPFRYGLDNPLRYTDPSGLKHRYSEIPQYDAAEPSDWDDYGGGEYDWSDTGIAGASEAGYDYDDESFWWNNSEPGLDNGVLDPGGSGCSCAETSNMNCEFYYYVDGSDVLSGFSVDCTSTIYELEIYTQCQSVPSAAMSYGSECYDCLMNCCYEASQPDEGLMGVDGVQTPW